MRFSNALARLGIIVGMSVLGLVEAFRDPRLTEVQRWRQATGSGIAILVLGALMVWLLRRK